MPIPFRPIQDLIACTVDPAERLLASGLVIPHVSDPERQESDERDVATVVATGDGKRLTASTLRPMSVAVGDRIIFGRNKGQLIRYGEVDYCIVREEHVIGRLNGHGFEPLGGVIVAEAVRDEVTTDAGLVVPQMGDRDEAIVVAVGPGTIQDDGSLQAPSVRVGDAILFNPRMAEPFRSDGRELLAMREEHIVCISNREAHYSIESDQCL
jgi:chaperonin GroES